MYDASGFAEQHLVQSQTKPTDHIFTFSYALKSLSLFGIPPFFHTRWVALSCLAPAIPKVPSGDEEDVIMNSALVAPLTLPTRLLLLLTLFGLLAFGLSSWKSKGNESYLVAEFGMVYSLSSLLNDLSRQQLDFYLNLRSNMNATLR